MKDADDAELWERITSLEPRYATYQTRTDREIPLIVLRPVSAN